MLAIVAALLWLFLVRGKSRSGAAQAGNAFLGGGISGARTQDYDSGAGNQLDNLLQSIYYREGGRPGDRNVRNNNPMDIEYGSFAKSHGAVDTDGRFAIFPDWGTGWDAMRSLVQAKVKEHPDWNFYDLFSYFMRGSTTAPPRDKEGDSDAYAEYVANNLGVSPMQTVSSIAGI